ncbi:MAG: lamin tail domain-containing protein [Bacteroidales bacterium]|nr:lamin tail domain-containing protein [Bacteroidales bacterium]
MLKIFKTGTTATVFSLLFLFSIHMCIFSQTIRINEFMALNQTTLTDEDTLFSDWIELFNPSTDAISLSGWSLTDDALLPQKWIFPDTTLNPGAYLIVFASGKNKTIAGSELHTNFKLSGDGEYFALFNASGEVITEFNPSFPPQQVDVSYGYFEGTFVEFADPTPGADNSQSSVTILPSPTFDKKHGFFDSPFTLQLSCEVGDADIYYTTDGSEPGKINGVLYTDQINIATTSIIRAISILGESKSKTVTQTYLFLDDVIHQPNNPIGYPEKWGPYTDLPDTSIADYEMDPEMMSDPVFASKVKEALKDIPTLSLVSDKNNFFNRTLDPVTGGIYIYTGPPYSYVGRGWERAVSAEYFNAKDSVEFQVNCGIRLQGGHSRRPEKNPKHSFQLVFRPEYGPTRLNYPIFGSDFAQSFNNLVLRAGFGNSWTHWTSGERVKGQLQRDIWTKDTQRAMGHHASTSIYVHLYINGIYWGVYAPSERMDADYAESYFGGDETEYDVIKDYMESGLDSPAVDGTTEAWDEMIDMANAGLSGNEAYMAIQGKEADGTPSVTKKPMIDIVNFTDYMILNYYGSNTDWDHHNWAAIRNREKPDKGFKFFSWDAEHMVKTVSGNMLNVDNNYCPSRIFNKLKENEEYKRLFASRVVKHCFGDGVLTPAKTSELWALRRSQVEKSMDAEAARWGDYRRDVHPYATAGPFDLYAKDTYWLTEQNYMNNTYFPQRTNTFINQLRNAGLFPQVNPPVYLVNGATPDGNIIGSGDVLTMTATQGTIYYTTDGSDPVAWESPGTEKVLIPENATKRVLVPKSDIGSTWYSDINYSDASWQVCSGSPGGIGYEKGTGYQSLITLDVSNDMYTGGTSPNTSCYVRIPFNVESADLASYNSLILGIRYDDGFVAYLNGKKVAEALAPASPVWNSASTATHESGSLETINLSNYIGDLKTGTNLLAIHALNAKTSSSDFIISATLTASDQATSGNISGSAIAYTGQVPLLISSHIQARAFYNGEWSALNDRFFIIPANYNDLKITEIHYHPLNEDTIDGDKFEFIEIKNTGASTLDLGRLQFIDGIDYQFPMETALKPGEFIVIASSSKYFAARYGFMPSGDYKDQLSNDGEQLVIASSSGDTVCAFEYNDGSSWPESPDGLGNSLVPTELNPTHQDDAYFWRASYKTHGSPGRDDLITESISAEVMSIDEDKILSQNYPNPFTDVTYIDYRLPFDANIRLAVFNIMGQQVAMLENGFRASGLYQAEWHTDSRFAEGIYYYRLEISAKGQNHAITRKMVLVK